MVALEGGMCGCSRGVCVVALGGHVWLLRGACVVAPGVCGCCQGGCVVALRWHAWLLPGGMHGCSRGMCVVALGGMRGGSGEGGIRGCSWEACMVAARGVHGCCWGGHAWLLWGVHGIRRDMEIRSMSGWYASYWNAFLLFRNVLNAILWCYLHKKLKISKSASEKKNGNSDGP